MMPPQSSSMLLPMLLYRPEMVDDDFVGTLQRWPFTNPNSQYKIYPTQIIIDETTNSKNVEDDEGCSIDGDPKTAAATTAATTTKTREIVPVAYGRIDNETNETRTGIWRCTKGKFECTEQGDELMTILRGRVKITDKTTKTATTTNKEITDNIGDDDIIELGPGDTLFCRDGKRLVWEILTDDVIKVFYGHKYGGYDNNNNYYNRPITKDDDGPSSSSSSSSLPMLVYKKEIVNNIIGELKEWPFTNPKSNYVVHHEVDDSSKPTTIRAFGRMMMMMMDNNTSSSSIRSSETETRTGIWKCTKGIFECTVQGDELFTVLKGQVKITDLSISNDCNDDDDGCNNNKNNVIVVNQGDTLFSRDNKRVRWEITTDEFIKVFYGHKTGGY